MDSYYEEVERLIAVDPDYVDYIIEKRCYDHTDPEYEYVKEELITLLRSKCASVDNSMLIVMDGDKIIDANYIFGTIDDISSGYKAIASIKVAKTEVLKPSESVTIFFYFNGRGKCGYVFALSQDYNDSVVKLIKHISDERLDKYKSDCKNNKKVADNRDCLVKGEREIDIVGYVNSLIESGTDKRDIVSKVIRKRWKKDILPNGNYIYDYFSGQTVRNVLDRYKVEGFIKHPRKK